MNSVPPPIAVVGISGIFPKASDCDQFWDNIRHKVDAIRQVPENRWAGSFDWVSSKNFEIDKAYSLHASLVDNFDFDPTGYQVDEKLLRDIDPLCQWVLQSSRTALNQTNMNKIDIRRMGIILAAIALPTDKSSSISRDILGYQLARHISGCDQPQPMTLASALSGRVVSIPASLVSQGLGLGGTSYTLDAACASSLYAVKLACDELQSHRADTMIAGGVSRPDCLFTQIGFSQLHALSPSGRCAPFDQSADGLVVGEGAGILVLKRLDDAIAHEDKIYGIIRGIGISNDMRGNLLAPESEGQLRAMRSAYVQAGWHPHDIDYIECHGTGTPVGDATELQSLQKLWGENRWQAEQCAIGSIKSMIGHLLTAAGAAGMIKTLLALSNKTLPPSLNYTVADPKSPLIDSPFKVQTEAAPWPEKKDGTSRKAAVNAFGFGGINAHVLIEEWRHDNKKSPQTKAIEVKKTRTIIQNLPSIAIVGMHLRFGALDTVQAFEQAIFNNCNAFGPALDERWKASEYINKQFGPKCQGSFIDSICMELGEFQIPPGEIPEILPQQLLMLKVAAGAMADAGIALRQAKERMGTIIGISFDYESTNSHLRWILPNLIRQWCKKSDFSETEINQWLQEAKDFCGPPLTASRTLGTLGGIVASRIARELRFGGPSFVVSSEEASGLQALEISRRMLQSYQVDAMLAGAVDLSCDERNMATLHSRLGLSLNGRIHPFGQNADGTVPGEGAVALILKRLDDAQANNDRIYAIIEGIGSAGGSVTKNFWADEMIYSESLKSALEDAQSHPEEIGFVECHASGVPSQDLIETKALHSFFGKNNDDRIVKKIAVGATQPIVGHTGAASGLASLAKTTLCLYHRMISPMVDFEKKHLPQWQKGPFYFPEHPVYWTGHRKACVSSMTSDGHCMHIVLGQSAKSEYDSRPPADHQHLRPMGRLPYGLFIIKGESRNKILKDLNRLENLTRKINADSTAPVESIAHKWYHESLTESDIPEKKRFCLAILAESQSKLLNHLAKARHAVETNGALQMNDQGGVYYDPKGFDGQGKIAFIYPGSGNHYKRMGTTLAAYWPKVIRDIEKKSDRFKYQYIRYWYESWNKDQTSENKAVYLNFSPDPLHTIFGQVHFGEQMTEILKNFGLYPNAVIGYSLGESAALFAMKVWPDLDHMLKRMTYSNLFKTQLTGQCEALRKAWKIPHNRPVHWKVAVIDCDVKTVDKNISNLSYVRRLIVNTPNQCVIGGLQEQVQSAIEKIECKAIYLDGVTTVHCDAISPVVQDYQVLHQFPTTSLDNVCFYSCAYEKALDLSSSTAAASITQQATTGFNFQKTIEQAYKDDIRIFIEVGPHCSCTRMISKTLNDKPHLAVAANHRGEFEPLALLKCLGTLAGAGVNIDLESVYGYSDDDKSSSSSQPTKTIKVPVGGNPLQLKLPAKSSLSEKKSQSLKTHEICCSPESEQVPQPMDCTEIQELNPTLNINNIIDQFNENVETTANAHKQFLTLSQELTSQFSDTLQWRNQLLFSLDSNKFDPPLFKTNATLSKQDEPKASGMPVAFDRTQCMEFAIGSVGKILGSDFDIIDTYKVRVRLPDEPLMLVDRIISVEGEKRSLGSGRIITEHDVAPDAWYLDGGCTPVCISVEAGQADLFLSAYLGIDHKVKGERAYRLLDAQIHFHRGLPKPGETIRYDIRIDKFVRQEDTYLFFFRFEGFIGGEHLISMKNGCAGFFTEEEVRNSGGIILTEDDKSVDTTIKGKPFKSLIDCHDESYDDVQIDALRKGDAGLCFGPLFKSIQLPRALCLPQGRMQLINRVISIEPEGGRFGKGFIKAEADIRPDDWYLTCHFVDDMVMPGTLMYECCAHTLRVLLLRLGWVTDRKDTCYEPVQKVVCRLKCRGPVTPKTRHVHYAVEIKEIGYHPEPYVIADAHMYADNQYIVFFKNMSMQMTNVTEQEILKFWQRRKVEQKSSNRLSHTPYKKPLFTQDHILAFAIGKPSEAFGQPYAIFDKERVIARLPGPPYCFMDRITAIEPKPWVLQPDGWIEAQYDVPSDAWYFSADGSGVMPFCVLLEIALQPCGWLAAYMGSALRSNNDLKFRNLGGKAIMHSNVYPANQTLTMRTRLTQVSEAADMIIEHFEFEVLLEDKTIYSGTTYFGYFTGHALAQQVGLRETVYKATDNDLAYAVHKIFDDRQPMTPQDCPKDVIFRSKGMIMPAKALCMIDGIDIFCPDGGRHGLGYIRGYKIVHEREWFFKAHFYQDPVCPGSLGIESFLQLIKFVAMAKWPDLIHSHRFEPICSHEHQWSYRGQVIPSNTKIIVDAQIIQIDDSDSPMIMADGSLQVDGIYIYKMDCFGLQLVPL